MDTPQDQHPLMNSDDELAKALSGGLQFEETPVAGAPVPAAAPKAVTDANQDAALASLLAPTMGNSPMPGSVAPAPVMTTPAVDPTPAPSVAPAPVTPVSLDPPAISKPHVDDKKTDPAPMVDTPKADKPAGELDKLKASALDELRPLVGKLDLPAEEKFDTLLLIIRSTDDRSLLDEAHKTATQITDDARRAQALLDIIKEVDYFNQK